MWRGDLQPPEDSTAPQAGRQAGRQAARPPGPIERPFPRPTSIAEGAPPLVSTRGNPSIMSESRACAGAGVPGVCEKTVWAASGNQQARTRTGDGRVATA